MANGQFAAILCRFGREGIDFRHQDTTGDGSEETAAGDARRGLVAQQANFDQKRRNGKEERDDCQVSRANLWEPQEKTSDGDGEESRPSCRPIRDQLRQLRFHLHRSDCWKSQWNALFEGIRPYV